MMATAGRIRPPHLVFVYGTLKRGEPNHHVLSDTETGEAVHVDGGRTVIKYPLVIGSRYNIPFLLDQPHMGHNVIGEVYAIDDRKLAALDELEAHPQFYRRRLEDVRLQSTDNETISAWMYVLPTWKPELIDAPHLEDYRTLGEHSRPYVSSEKCQCEQDLWM